MEIYHNCQLRFAEETLKFNITTVLHKIVALSTRNVMILLKTSFKQLMFHFVSEQDINGMT